MRAALYARFSSELQNAASTADQLRLCRRYAEQMGATVVAEFEDAGISGAAMANRPGFLGLMKLARSRQIDLIIAEHTDRLSRSGGDGYYIFKELKSLGVDYVTVNQGQVTTLHQGVSSLLSELTLEEVAKKTRRGLSSVVRSGRAASMPPFGYELVVAFDGNNERVRGLRKIAEPERPIVERIFRDYANGLSPYAIARALNDECVPGPKGRQWNASTICGDASRQVGLLRNELYRGVRVWGRNGTTKDVHSGKRLALPGRPAGEVQRQDVPELRLIDDGLWARVQARLAEMSIGPQGENRGRRRPKTLLAGLIRCGVCGHVMTASGTGNRLRCGRRAQRGPAGCSNTQQPRYDAVEARILASIQANLLHPDVVADFVAEFQRTVAERRRNALQGRASAERELADVTRRAERLVHQVEEGMPWTAVAERHAQLAGRKVELEAQLASLTGGAEVVQLIPSAAGLYRTMVEDLHAALGEPENSRSAEARDRIRALVTEIRMIPKEGRGMYDLDFDAQLAPVLGVEQCGQVRLAG